MTRPRLTPRSPVDPTRRYQAPPAPPAACPRCALVLRHVAPHSSTVTALGRSPIKPTPTLQQGPYSYILARQLDSTQARLRRWAAVPFALRLRTLDPRPSDAVPSCQPATHSHERSCHSVNLKHDLSTSNTALTLGSTIRMTAVVLRPMPRRWLPDRAEYEAEGSTESTI